jgi:hypothetical protein
MEGWGGRKWGRRGGGDEGDGFIDCVRVIGLVLGGWAVGAVVRAMQQETVKTREGA